MASIWPTVRFETTGLRHASIFVSRANLMAGLVDGLDLEACLANDSRVKRIRHMPPAPSCTAWQPLKAPQARRSFLTASDQSCFTEEYGLTYENCLVLLYQGRSE
jgi:hypothetical protein